MWNLVTLTLNIDFKVKSKVRVVLYKTTGNYLEAKQANYKSNVQFE